MSIEHKVKEHDHFFLQVIITPVPKLSKDTIKSRKLKVQIKHGFKEYTK